MEAVTALPSELRDLTTLLADTATVVDLPLRVPFRGLSSREVMLCQTPGGWVEWSAFTEYGPAEAARWLRSCFLMAADANPGIPSPFLPLPPTQRQDVQVNATIPAVDVDADPQSIPRLLGRYPGCTVVKVKVAERPKPPTAGSAGSARAAGAGNGADMGHVPADGAPVDAGTGSAVAGADGDVRRVTAVREHFRAAGEPAPLIRIDANAAWSVDEAFNVLQRMCADGPLDYVEQPCATVAELRDLRRRIAAAELPVRVAADELIRKASDPLAVVRAGACEVAVVKVAPLGGVDRVLGVAREVAEHGVALTVSSALETGVGMEAGLRAAALIADAVPVPPQAAGLATGSLFVRDVAERQVREGHIRLGLGEVDADLIAAHTAGADRRDWWLERLSQAATLVAVD